MEAAVGLGLAFLPLLISAAEHYKDCAHPLSRYKKFAKEADRYLQQLAVQRTIFRNQCQLLLETIVEPDVASLVLCGAGNDLWADQLLTKQLTDLLGDSSEACTTTVHLIEDELQEIEAKSLNLAKAVDQERSVAKEYKAQRVWKEKLRFSFSRSHLSDNIATLRTLNGDFERLYNLVKSPSFNRPHEAPHASSDFNKAVLRYQNVGEASGQIYEALEEACTKHTEYLAYFCIEAEETTPNGIYESTGVKFSIAFAAVPNQSTPIWFVIDATIGKSLPLDNPDTAVDITDLSKSLKRYHADCTSSQMTGKTKKRVRFHSPRRTPLPGFAPPVLPSGCPLRGPMTRDFCDLLRQYVNPSAKANVCIAILENSRKRSQNFVYPAPFSLHLSNQKELSLHHFITSTSRARVISSFPLYERLRLAKRLAVAVLRYHATPWAQNLLSSEDICFFGIDVASQAKNPQSLAAPHLTVRVKSPNESPTTATPPPSTPGVRNIFLFKLGILLLEIAYSCPWNSLRPPANLAGEQRTPYTEFQQARMFVETECSGMGIKYDRIVQQLVECDFGCGRDLGKIELQVAIHRDVICPLEKLEQQLRALQLDD